MYTFCSPFAIRSFLCTGSREVALVPILAAEMGEPQEAQRHTRSLNPRSIISLKNAETVRFFMA